MLKRILGFGLMIAFVVGVVGSASWGVPPYISFSGRLTDMVGKPIEETSKNIKFSIWSDLSSGSELWSDTYNDVPVDKGVFNVLLGPIDFSTALANDDTVYLEVDVDADAAPMEPRQQLVSVPYAYRAKVVDEIPTLVMEQIVLEAEQDLLEVLNKGSNASGYPGDVLLGTGNVGIGTPSPGADLHIKKTEVTTLILRDDLNAMELTLGTATGKTFVRSGSGDPLRLGTFNFPDTITISDTDGNVGIGNTDPGYNLDVAGDINYTGALYQNGSPVTMGGAVWDGPDVNEDIYYDAGNVGIGTTSPGAKLDVRTGIDAPAIYAENSFTNSADVPGTALEVAAGKIKIERQTESFIHPWPGGTPTYDMHVPAGTITFPSPPVGADRRTIRINNTHVNSNSQILVSIVDRPITGADVYISSQGYKYFEVSVHSIFTNAKLHFLVIN